MGDKVKPNKQRKLMSVREIQEEYLNIDSRRLRVFLNTYLSFVKIGRLYYYQRSEVEALLTDKDNSYEFKLDDY